MKKIIVLLIFLSLILGCEKDLYENQISNNKSQGVSFDQFKRETNLKNFKTTIKIPNERNLSANRTSDGNYELSDFKVNIDYINKLISYDEKITYTFRVIPKIITSKSIFNLVVFKKNDNWEMSILELTPTDENLLKLEQGITREFEGTIKNVYDSSVTETNPIGARVVIKFHCPNLYPCGNGYCDMCLSRCLKIVTFDEPRSFGVDYVIPNSENGGGESSHSGGGAVDLENIINNPVFSDPTGYFFDPNMPPIGVDEYFRNSEASAFWNSLSEGVNGEKAWANQHPDEYSEIIEYYLDNFSEENEELANELIDQMVLNPQLDLDIDASSKSPTNIDLNVQDTTAAAVKLRCLYSKLTQSQSFKDLFLNTFGVNNRINISLEVADDLPPNVEGRCRMSFTTANGITTYLNTIKIKRSILEEGK